MLANPEKQTEVIHYEKIPSGFSIMWREFRKDKLAMFSYSFSFNINSRLYNFIYYETRRYRSSRSVRHL